MWRTLELLSLHTERVISRVLITSQFFPSKNTKLIWFLNTFGSLVDLRNFGPIFSSRSSLGESRCVRKN
ncbi:hypothetical protein Q8A67_000764 [Cirrhinus molitorella]|uniref:Uncharacterized protein n=1 Tax=Cirrhinus molitorella TaxID=172907 RepID=A0AA88U0G8_9TELE|nr:hypothetical protein Q8A67_000764 [Cirrhinus molitorella]